MKKIFAFKTKEKISYNTNELGYVPYSVKKNTQVDPYDIMMSRKAINLFMWPM